MFFYTLPVAGPLPLTGPVLLPVAGGCRLPSGSLPIAGCRRHPSNSSRALLTPAEPFNLEPKWLENMLTSLPIGSQQHMTESQGICSVLLVWFGEGLGWS
jgi:hypothetical protein